MFCVSVSELLVGFSDLLAVIKIFNIRTSFRIVSVCSH